MHTIRYKGCVAKQSNYNHHVMIYEDDRMVMHIPQSERLSEKELRGLINHYLALKNASAVFLEERGSHL